MTVNICCSKLLQLGIKAPQTVVNKELLVNKTLALNFINYLHLQGSITQKSILLLILMICRYCQFSNKALITIPYHSIFRHIRSELMCRIHI